MQRRDCIDCGSPLGAGAVKCRCGWKMGAAPAVVRHIDCCYAGCTNCALSKVPTKTGWANVCRVHYGDIEIVRKVTDAPHMNELREIYQRRKQGAGYRAARNPELGRIEVPPMSRVPLPDELGESFADLANP